MRFLRRTRGSPPDNPQQSILGPKIEALQDNHPGKPLCLFGVSLLFPMVGQARCLIRIAEMFRLEGLLDAAEETVPRASELREADNHRLPCECNYLLVRICRLRCEGENAIDYYQTVRGITSSRGRPDGLPFAHFDLAFALLDQQGFDDESTHFAHARSYVRDNLLLLGTMMELQASCRYYQEMLDGGRSGALRAIDIFWVRT